MAHRTQPHLFSGTIAVMQQVYADSNARPNANAGLIKAALFNSVEIFIQLAPIIKSGFGLLNSFRRYPNISTKRIEKGSVSNHKLD
jgi:hypothetical protein